MTLHDRLVTGGSRALTAAHRSTWPSVKRPWIGRAARHPRAVGHPIHSGPDRESRRYVTLVLRPVIGLAGTRRPRYPRSLCA
jgi:hypothetical protein